MADLIAFLTARLSEDEAYAKEPEGWNEYDEGDPGSPARVLAEVAAKRRIIDEHRPKGPEEGCPTCTEQTITAWAPEDSPCPTLRLLALPYDQHSDYREEWRP